MWLPGAGARREIECGGGGGSFRGDGNVLNPDCGIGCVYPSSSQDTFECMGFIILNLYLHQIDVRDQLMPLPGLPAHSGSLWLARPGR